MDREEDRVLRGGDRGDPCIQASGERPGLAVDREERDPPDYLLCTPSPGCYNCSQHEYFDHSKGTCVPCGKPHLPLKAPRAHRPLHTLPAASHLGTPGTRAA